MGAFLKKFGKKSVIPEEYDGKNAVLEKNGRKIADVQVVRDCGYYVSPSQEVEVINNTDSKDVIPAIPTGYGMLKANLILPKKVYSEYFLNPATGREFNEGLVLISDKPEVTYEGCKIVKLNGTIEENDVHIVSADVVYTSKHSQRH